MARIAPIHTGPIEKGGKQKQAAHRIVCEKHLAFIRKLPCLASGVTNVVIAHHLKLDLNRMGRRSGDDTAVPLNNILHQGYPESLHSGSESVFWNELGIDPRPIAKFFWENTGNIRLCTIEIKAMRAAAQVRKAHGVRLLTER